MKLNKKTVAKEWLVLVVCALFSFSIFPVIFLYLANSEHSLSTLYGELFEAILTGEIDAYVFILLPYLLVQLIRSIIWAIKTLKSKNN